MKKLNLPKDSSVVVTGGAGFIGSHWVDCLIKNNIRVFVIDNLITGSTSNVNRKVGFFKCNIIHYAKLSEIFKKAKPTVVYHFAANTNVPLSVKNPLYDFQTLRGSLNIFDLCKKFHIKKVVYLSSGFIYGNTFKRPIKETEPFKPTNPYAISKKCAEDYLKFYGQVHHLNYVILRPATIYGPRQTTGAMADYIQKLANNSQAEMYGDGSKTRDYVFIEDFIDALVGVTRLARANNQVFNVGSAKETSLRNLYSEIAKILGKQARPIFKPERRGELQFYSSDYTTLHKLTGWKPTISLNEGLKRTIKWWGDVPR